MPRKISFLLNGEATEVAVEDHWSLLHMLREELDLTGTKEGCGSGECGACTVILDGMAVNACLYLAAEADGRELLTIEGLAEPNGTLHSLQKAFVEHGAIQCGFCTPGMILSAQALLAENPNPTDAEIRHALAGNLCRCTGYLQIFEAVKAAAAYQEEEIKVVPRSAEPS